MHISGLANLVNVWSCREKPTVQSPSLAASNSNAQILTSSSDVLRLGGSSVLLQCLSVIIVLRLQGRVVDLTTDEELTEDTIIQTVVTDSIHEVQSSPEAPPYSTSVNR